jgi:hypothetical protein
VTTTTVAGLPARATVRELRERCPSVTRDDTTATLDDALGLRVEYVGASIHVTLDSSAYASGLPADARATYWLASGDSVRLPGGELLPRTVGALRQRDSAGIVVVPREEGAPAAFVVLCRYPTLTIDLGATAQVAPAAGAPYPGQQSIRVLAPDDTTPVTGVGVAATPDSGSAATMAEWLRGFCPE